MRRALSSVWPRMLWSSLYGSYLGERMGADASTGSGGGDAFDTLMEVRRCACGSTQCARDWGVARLRREWRVGWRQIVAMRRARCLLPHLDRNFALCSALRDIEKKMRSNTASHAPLEQHPKPCIWYVFAIH
eukprot:365052-Chlamydomonas_euryale.AAC.46